MKWRRGCRRAIGARAPIVVPQQLHQRWSLDFVSDQQANGWRFRLLNVIDEFNRERLASVPDFSLSGLRVIRELEAIIACRGKLAMIVSDNGTELTAMPFYAGLPISGSSGTTTRPASPCRTPSSKVSMAACVTGASTSTSSPRWPRPGS